MMQDITIPQYAIVFDDPSHAFEFGAYFTNMLLINFECLDCLSQVAFLS